MSLRNHELQCGIASGRLASVASIDLRMLARLAATTAWALNLTGETSRNWFHKLPPSATICSFTGACMQFLAGLQVGKEHTGFAVQDKQPISLRTGLVQNDLRPDTVFSSQNSQIDYHYGAQQEQVRHHSEELGGCCGSFQQCL